MAPQPAEPGHAESVRTEPARDPKNIGLLGDSDLTALRAKWEQTQIAFVDHPREAVQAAHDLVDQVVDRLTRVFEQQRNDLEGTWTRGGDVSTEDLRLALQRYRSFFNRLLST
jgi:hypothetical protein